MFLSRKTDISNYSFLELSKNRQSVSQRMGGLFVWWLVFFFCMLLSHALACLIYLDCKFLGWQDTLPRFTRCQAQWDPVFTGPCELQWVNNNNNNNLPQTTVQNPRARDSKGISLQEETCAALRCSAWQLIAFDCRHLSSSQCPHS